MKTVKFLIGWPPNYKIEVRTKIDDPENIDINKLIKSPDAQPLESKIVRMVSDEIDKTVLQEIEKSLKSH